MRKFLLVLIALPFVACSRGEKTGTAKITFSHGGFEKVGASSLPAGYELTHIAINVRGPDMPLTQWSWDACEGSNCNGTPPSIIEIEVPTGAVRKIQYLGVFEHNTTGQMIFTYGDTTQSVVSGNNAVSISAAAFGSASGKETTLAGQYVKSVDSGKGVGPTGIVDVQFQPPNGAEAMIIDHSEMFSGWFKTFALEGAPMQYVLRSTGEVLQNVSRTYADGLLTGAPSTPHLLKFISPNIIYVNDGTPRRQTNGGDVFFGFWGPSLGLLTSPKACFPNSAVFSPTLHEQASGGDIFSYSGSSAGDIFVSAGGQGESSSECSGGGTAYVNRVKLKPDGLVNSRHGVIPFEGPFKQSTFSSDCGGPFPGMAHGCYEHANSQIRVKWSYIPNLVTSPNSITGVTLFKKIISSYCDEACRDNLHEKQSDGYRCKEMATLGFTKHADYNLATEDTGDINGISAPTSGQILGMLCPYREVGGVREYFSSGLFIDSMQAPLPSVNNIRLTTVGDADTSDNYLVDDLSTNAPLTAWDPIPGTATYDVSISPTAGPGGSYTDCEGTTPSTNSNMGTNCRSTLNSLTDGVQVYVKVTARAANGTILATGVAPHKLVLVEPTIVVMNSIICSDNVGSLQMDLDFSYSPGTTLTEWKIYDNSIEVATSPGFEVIAGSAPHITIAGAGVPYGLPNAMLELKLRPQHSSGYNGALFTLPISYDGAGNCSF